MRDAERIARAFHEEYEQMAPAYGWETQKKSRVAWDDLPDNQRKLMVHVVGNLLAADVFAIEPPENTPDGIEPWGP